MNILGVVNRLKTELQFTQDRIDIEIGDFVINPPDSPVGNPDLWKSRSAATAARRRGYKGGAFKGNYRLGLKTMPKTDYPDAIDSTGKVSKSQIQQVAYSDTKLGGIHYISNNRPYSVRLDTGWSTQAPNGILMHVTNNIQQIVDNVVKNGY